ncbi:MAG: 16S rRNA (uracil(1498)-N(3))-methyltransferase [Mycoplasmatales bacterium]
MQQYYLNNELEHSVSIKDTRFHYLKNVIRIKKEEHILLFNGINKAEYQILEINKSDIKAQKIRNLKNNNHKLEITLLTGVLKKDNTELVIQKSVELGINKIILTKFINSVARIDNKEEKKLQRYNEIALSACEQSKRDTIASVEYLDLLKKLEFKLYDKIYLLYEQENNINSLYKEINNCSKQDKILLIVGPEGGFDVKELDYFQENKITFTSLGTNILRSETAAIMSVGLTINIMNNK